MTKEQAIKEVKNYDNYPNGISKECREYIIKALEQQPSDDCVSRANLLKKFEDRFIELQKAHQTDKQLGVNWCINTLKDTPPVTHTYGICKDCSHRDPENKMCDCGHSITWQLPRPDEWYCKDFEK